jgi:hypothetical protein
MPRTIRTKAELLEHIARGPAAVHMVHATTIFRVSVPADEDPNSGIWISLSPENGYIVEDYATSFARVGRRELRLTRREANEIARLIARTMRLRARPWRYQLPATSGRRRRHIPKEPQCALSS